MLNRLANYYPPVPFRLLVATRIAVRLELVFLRKKKKLKKKNLKNGSMKGRSPSFLRSSESWWQMSRVAQVTGIIAGAETASLKGEERKKEEIAIFFADSVTHHSFPIFVVSIPLKALARRT